MLALGSLLAITTLMASGCAKTPTRAGIDPTQEGQRTLTRYRFARVMMGSRCEITLEATNEPEAAQAVGRAFDEIKRIERVLSDYDAESESMRIMELQPGIDHQISETLLEVLLVSGDIHAASGGAFDPTIGALTHLWRNSAREGEIPSQESIDNARDRIGFEHVQIDLDTHTLIFDQTGMILDFGGIGKGYAAQKAVELLTNLGYPVACVNLGGDLHLGEAPSNQPEGWRIEIVTGLGRTQTLHLKHCGIATSGDLERYYEHQGVRYSHIIDPRTGMGITQRRAATVIAPDATIADALASANSVMGERGKDQLEQAYPDASIVLVSRALEADD